MSRFAQDMASNLYGNPHSASASSQLSTSRVEDVRLRLLEFFGADPTEFDLVFVPNTTAGVKLLVDALRNVGGGFDYIYHRACHTSLIGVREEARRSKCIDSEGVARWLENGELPLEEGERTSSIALFAYSAQSHMNGLRYSLDWSSRIRSTSLGAQKVYTLLDIASYATSSPLEAIFADPASAPDFAVLSLYKIFGFPDLGALVVRREAESMLRHRRYFGGGTVDMVLCGKEDWHATKAMFIHEGLEDGTLPFHNIFALNAALDSHMELFGSMAQISKHTSYLRNRLYTGLASLKHANGASVCRIYAPRQTDPPPMFGPILSFNLLTPHSTFLSLTEFEKLANIKNFHLRTGGLCSPGEVAAALDLDPWEMKRSYANGLKCGGEDALLDGRKPTGVIRVSLGPISTKGDVDRFVGFVKEFWCDGDGSETIEKEEDLSPLNRSSSDASRNMAKGEVADPQSRLHPPPTPTSTASTALQISPTSTPAQRPQLTLSNLYVYPLKSCAPFVIPPHVSWPVYPEGLLFDREWCLLHEGSLAALTQKRYPKMVFIKPDVDLETGVMRVEYTGTDEDVRRNLETEKVEIRLEDDPGILERSPVMGLERNEGKGDRIVVRETRSKICGDVVTAQTYTSKEANNWFSTVLGVKCLLAHFPRGGVRSTMRTSMARHSSLSSSPSSSSSSSPSVTSNGGSGITPPADIDEDCDDPCVIMPGSFPANENGDNGDKGDDDYVDSDTRETQTLNISGRYGEREAVQQPILLSNESPILVVYTPSVSSLLSSIGEEPSPSLSPLQFRPNMVLSPSPPSNTSPPLPPFSEESWSNLEIHPSNSPSPFPISLKSWGPCQRCQMICIDQQTGERGQEPFVTLAKERKRKRDGRVYFGIHVGLDRAGEMLQGGEVKVRVGDSVYVE